MMHCDVCPCSCEQRYPESNEVDWSCLAGHDIDEDEEDGIVFDEDGEMIGCNIDIDEAQKIHDASEDAILDYYAGFVAYLEEQEKLESEVN